MDLLQMFNSKAMLTITGDIKQLWNVVLESSLEENDKHSEKWKMQFTNYWSLYDYSYEMSLNVDKN